jgi:intracellular multiplication protein IcmL
MAGLNRLGTSEAKLDRYETYKRGFQLATIGLCLMGVVTLVSVSMAYWAFTSKPEPRYFATREDGGIIPLIAVNQPFLQDGQVTNFAVEAVTTSMTMDFANWRQDLAESSKYFQRPDGYQNFLAALENAKILDFVRDRNLVSTAIANGAVITGRGVDALGRYSWTLQIPLRVTYQSANERTTQELLAEVVVSRVPTWESPSAIGITRITMRTGR